MKTWVQVLLGAVHPLADEELGLGDVEFVQSPVSKASLVDRLQEADLRDCNVLHIADLYDPTHPNTYPNFYLGPDKSRYIDNDPFLLLKKNLDKIKGRLRIQIWCGTKDDGHLPSVRDFHHALLAAGVDHTYMEIEGLAHNHKEMLSRYQSIWFDYHVESLRRNAK